MRRLLFVVVLSMGATAMLRSAIAQGGVLVVTSGVGKAIDGAFRDGLYQGELAAARGSERHISRGRWAVDKDRASFTEGYQQGYAVRQGRRSE